MKTLKVTKRFKDKENNDQIREIDEVFEVSNKRGDEILKSEENVAEEVTEKK